MYHGLTSNSPNRLKTKCSAVTEENCYSDIGSEKVNCVLRNRYWMKLIMNKGVLKVSRKVCEADFEY